MNLTRFVCACWTCLLAGLWSASAHGHLLNMTKVHVAVQDLGRVYVTMEVDLTRSAGSGERYYMWSRTKDPLNDPDIREAIAALTRATVVSFNGVRIGLTTTRIVLPTTPFETFTNPLAWPMTTVVLEGPLPRHLLPRHDDAPGVLRGSLDVQFPFEEPIAFTLGDGDRTVTRWLAAGQSTPRFLFGAKALGANAGVAAEEGGVWQVVGQYLAFGFTHIIPKGLDHILFVLGLYLGSRSIPMLLWQVTAFTLAHSVTLVLSALKFVAVAPAVVEPLIAASIVWVGVENIVRPQLGWPRWLLVFAFGLLHGLGFASALAEIGLPGDTWVAALVSFNIGVELGQIAVIGLMFAATGWFLDRQGYRRTVVIPGSAAIALLALVWTVQRL